MRMRKLKRVMAFLTCRCDKAEMGGYGRDACATGVCTGRVACYLNVFAVHAVS